MDNFKIYLKHKHLEIIMEDLILRLWVEEYHKRGDSVEGAKAIVIEGVTTTKLKFQKQEGYK